MKKIFAILLAVVMISACFAGCSGDATTSSQSSAGSQSSAAQSSQDSGDDPAGPVVNEYGWAVPEETLTFSVYFGQGDRDQQEEWRASSKDFLLEKFNVSIEKECSDTTPEEALALMVVSGNYPDVILSSRANMDEWIAQGRAQDLTDLLPEYAPNVIEQITTDILNLWKTDGKQYILPKATGALEVPTVAICLRWDWWQDAGAPEFTTMDDFYEVITKIAADKGTTDMGEKIYATGGHTNIKDLSAYVRNAFGFYASDWKLEGDTLSHWLFADEAYDVLKYINQFFRDGVIDPDSYIQDYDTYVQKLVNERYVSTIGYWHEGEQPLAVWLTEEDYQDTKRMVQFYPRQSQDYVLTYENTGGGNGLIITNNCDNVEEVLTWLNFEATDFGMRICCWGVPVTWNDLGVWDVDASGEAYMLEDVKQEFADGTFAYMDRVFIGYNQHWMVSTMKMPDTGDYTYIDQNTRDVGWKKIMFDNSVGTLGDSTAVAIISPNPEDEVATIKQTITDTLNVELIKLYSATSDDELAVLWDELKVKLEGIGVEKYVEFYNQEFQKNLATMRGTN